MSSFFRMVSPSLASALVALAGIGTSTLMASLDLERQKTDARARVVGRLSLVQTRLAAVIRSTFSPVDGLVHLISIEGGIPPSLFHAMAERFVGQTPAIRNVTVARGDEIQLIHPLAGNEKALGVRYASLPDQLVTVNRARKLGRPVLAGPVKLVQGGEGFIQRTPVFVAEQDGRTSRYWGSISIVAHEDILLRNAGILDDPELTIALVGRDGMGGQGTVISGDPTLGGQTAITADVEVPGGVWQMRAIPRNGWPEISLWTSSYFLFGVPNSLLLAGLCWLLMRRQQELMVRNHSLSEEMEARRRIEESLKDEEARFRTFFESSPDPNWIIEGGKLTACNAASVRLLGYAGEEKLLEADPSRLSPFAQPDGELSLVKVERMMELAKEKGLHRFEWVYRRADGTEFPAEVTLSGIMLKGRPATYCVWRDISAFKRSQADLERLAHFDPLTQLPNRILFRDRLAQAFVRAERHPRKVAVILLDLDGFKTVNDSLGHPVGDRLLKLVAERLLLTVRVEDTVARLGGDEFALILSNLEEGEDAIEVARKILLTTQEPFDVGGHGALVTTSIGIAVFPDDGDEPNTLIRNADAAMYRAKESGRNTYRFYQAEMTLAAQARLDNERGLRRAIEKREFEVWYQPKTCLASGHYLGAEALVRWRDPERGLIPPGDFIPLAEQTGLIVPLGELVLDQVCGDARRWLDAGLPVGRLAINVAGPQLYRSDFVSILGQALGTYGLSPEALEIEVTETFMMENPDEVRRILDAIKAMGIATAIDDFGTGYSSLSYLKQLPIDTLKIDRAFISNLPGDTHDIAITRAILAMGRSLQFNVVAEGIETEAQRSFLQTEGCAEGQGYFFAKPMPAPEFVRWLKAREASRLVGTTPSAGAIGPAASDRGGDAENDMGGHSDPVPGNDEPGKETSEAVHV